MNDNLTQKIAFDAQGLVPAIVQEWGTGEVLMLAYMNQKSLNLSLETGFTHFWSRSRRKIWKKGETSGHVQKIKGMFYDCDADTVLVIVEQTGPACHTNNKSCFFNKIVDYESTIKGSGAKGGVISALGEKIEERKTNPSKGSYTSTLLAAGAPAIEAKIIEESQEVVAASGGSERHQIIYESADLIYHLMVLLSCHGLTMKEVEDELSRRFGRPPKKTPVA